MLKRINYTKLAYTLYDNSILENQEYTPEHKIRLMEVYLFYLNECIELNKRVINLIEINDNSLFPLPLEYLISEINYGFDNVPKNEPGFTLKQELELNASFRLGYIDGLTINIKNCKLDDCKKLWSEIEQMDLTKFVSVAKDFKVLNALYTINENHDINKLLKLIKVKEEELILLNAIATKTTPEATDNIENFVNKLFLKLKIDSDLVPDFIKVLNKEAIDKRIKWKEYKTTTLIKVLICFQFENIKDTIINNFEIKTEIKSLDAEISRLKNDTQTFNSSNEYKIFKSFYLKNKKTSDNKVSINVLNKPKI